MVVKEPVFIGEQENPVAVLIPIDLYRSWQHQLETDDESLAQASSLKPAKQEKSSGFEREKAAFEKMKPNLLAKYHGKCVAVVGGKVVEVGNDKIKIIDRVRERFGQVSMYVQWVTDKPRVYRFPHRRVARQ